MSDTNLVYAYAVLRRTPEAAAATARLRGVAGEPIHLVTPAVTSPELAFAVGHVPPADYADAPLQAHLDDLDWLESTVRSHHAVVAALVASGAAVLPLAPGHRLPRR
ncbi:GvpL/GvpF family gas vesicle protein [Streptomyces sp. NPDC092370]|uniref:GvpL/GvpF family gas vesicle protein n=1 Tax=Streptomyces sp. NPDC092370 TaxID=3366016 RepID=UPI00380AE5D7